MRGTYGPAPPFELNLPSTRPSILSRNDGTSERDLPYEQLGDWISVGVLGWSSRRRHQLTSAMDIGLVITIRWRLGRQTLTSRRRKLAMPTANASAA